MVSYMTAPGFFRHATTPGGSSIDQHSTVKLDIETEMQ